MTGEMREATGQRAAPAFHASPVTAGFPPAAPNFRRGFVIAGIAAVFMAFIGALGTDAAGLGVRLGYWLAVMVTGSALGTGVAFAVQSWGRLRRRPLAEGALVSLLIAMPLTAVVIGANLLAFGPDAPGRDAIVWVFGVVLLVTAMMTAVNRATHPAAVPPIAAPPPGSVPIAQAASTAPAIMENVESSDLAGLPESPRLLARLPLRLRHARLLALEAEDHYLRVHTDAGSDLILLRLPDAIAETDDLAGTRVHRSWWVARTAVNSVNRQGGRIGLDIGLAGVVPVSRTHAATLRAAGWLD